MNDEFSRQWIIENAQKILSDYSIRITIRQLHYRLVAIGMTNDTNHYKRVVGAMTKARWDGIISMGAFIDRERTMFGETEDETKDLQTEIEHGKEQINAWMNAYNLNRWSNQENYIEVGIEKKALQGVFEDPCRSADVGLAPFKGYSSITFLHEAVYRFEAAIANGKIPIMLYFGDYDPSGLDIPRSIKDNLSRMGVDIEVKRIALNPDQIQEMNLPGVPAKLTDSRTNNWSGGKVVECDAVEPMALAQMCRDAIEEYFNLDRYSELKNQESDEGTLYRKALKDYVLGFGI
jgi:hypothetical protein